MKKLVLATLLASSAIDCSNTVRKPFPDPPVFPLDLNYGTDVIRLEIDEHRVVVLHSREHGVLYGKVPPSDFERLKSLLASDEFRSCLRHIRDANEPVWNASTLHLYARPYGSSSKWYPPYMVVLDPVDQIPAPLRDMIQILDSAGTQVFGDKYEVIVPAQRLET